MNNFHSLKRCGLRVIGLVVFVLCMATASAQQTGIVRTVAGGGDCSDGDGGPAIRATFCSPSDLAYDQKGNLYVADAPGFIRRIDTEGIITTVAGRDLTYPRDAGSTSRFSGDGGPATDALLNYPGGVAVSQDGSIYIADTYNLTLRSSKVSGSIES